MKALVLAAGLGTRLRPLTDHLPKCLVPIKGQPLLGIWLSRLSAAGLGPILVNTHYLSEKVRAFVEAGDHGDQVRLAHETTLLGTAGTLREHLGFFGGQDGILLHGDNYCLADFREFVAAHAKRPSGCLMTMMVFRADQPSSCGIVNLDGRGVVVGFAEKPSHPSGDLANGAIYILTAELLADMSHWSSDIVDFSTQVIPRLIGRIFAFETSAPLIDIGTPRSYAMANDS